MRRELVRELIDQPWHILSPASRTTQLPTETFKRTYIAGIVTLSPHFSTHLHPARDVVYQSASSSSHRLLHKLCCHQSLQLDIHHSTFADGCTSGTSYQVDRANRSALRVNPNSGTQKPGPDLRDADDRRPGPLLSRYGQSNRLGMGGRHEESRF
jgi:hypothetical protein